MYINSKLKFILLSNTYINIMSYIPLRLTLNVKIFMFRIMKRFRKILFYLYL